MDIDCNKNDGGGISPKNICQPCIDKLQIVHEFKWKSNESDKYLKQIISHSSTTPLQAEEPDITPYNPAPTHPPSNTSFYSHGDEDSLLLPLSDDDDDDEDAPVPVRGPITVNGIDLKKGQRHGEFVCDVCNKLFRYVKAYKNHLKLHKSTTKNLSYYKKKQLQLKQAAVTGTSIQQGGGTKIKTGPKPKVTTTKFKAEPQAEYDSLSPYNSPGPYENESVTLHNNRDSSPDFGDFMLNTSQQLLHEENLLVENSSARRSRGRPKKSIMDTDEIDDEDDNYNPNRRQRSSTKKSIETLSPKSDTAEKRSVGRPRKVSNEISHVEDPLPKKRPGPLSKTRPQPRSQEKAESFIEGFNEVDITKMLKSARKEFASKFY